MSQASPNTFPENLPLKLRKDREQAGHSPARWCGEIQSFRQRPEADVEIAKFLEGRDEIGDRLLPALYAIGPCL
jgi:hypothetical protein